jgi:hypothetical protein
MSSAVKGGQRPFRSNQARIEAAGHPSPFDRLSKDFEI